MATWEGEFLTTRRDKGNKVALYRVQEIFVEVFYNEAANQILRFNLFISRNRLNLYCGAQVN